MRLPIVEEPCISGNVCGRNYTGTSLVVDEVVHFNAARLISSRRGLSGDEPAGPRAGGALRPAQGVRQSAPVLSPGGSSASDE